MHNRILQLIDNQKINIAKLEILLGVYQGSLRKQIKNERPIGSDKLEQIAELYPDLDLNWLIRGEGSMYKNPEADKIENLQGELKSKDKELIEIQKHRDQMFDMYHTLKDTLELLKKKNA